MCWKRIVKCTIRYIKKAQKHKGGTNIEDLQFIIEEDPFEKGSLLNAHGS